MSRFPLRTLRGQVRANVGGETYLPSAVIDRELDEAHKRLCKEFGINRSSWSTSAVSDKRFYRPPPEMIELERVEFDEKIMDFIMTQEIWDMGDDITIQTPTWTEDV